jgi:hypothetical protein
MVAIGVVKEQTEVVDYFEEGIAAKKEGRGDTDLRGSSREGECRENSVR